MSLSNSQWTVTVDIQATMYLCADVLTNFYLYHENVLRQGKKVYYNHIPLQGRPIFPHWEAHIGLLSNAERITLVVTLKLMQPEFASVGRKPGNTHT